MKKLLTGILAMALAATVCVPAFAETNDGTKSTTTDVKGMYDAGGESPDVVAVDITWNDMSFDFTEGKKTWNPNTHKMEQEQGKWTSEFPRYVALINHSNVDVHAAFAFRGEGDVKGVFTADTLNLESGKNYTVDDAQKHEQLTFLTITGGSITKSGKVGTIAVTLTVPKAAEVATEEELAAALSAGGATGLQIKLTDNIALTNTLKLDGTKVKNGCVIDLNGKTISCETDTALHVLQRKVTFKNGTIATASAKKFAVNADAGSDVTLENCTVKSEKYIALFINGGTVCLKDSAIDCGDTLYTPITLQAAYETGAKLTVSGTTTIQTKSATKVTSEGSSTVRFEAGSYNFDPTGFVDSTGYNVAESAGIWTVTAK